MFAMLTVQSVLPTVQLVSQLSKCPAIVSMANFKSLQKTAYVTHLSSLWDCCVVAFSAAVTSWQTQLASALLKLAVQLWCGLSVAVYVTKHGKPRCEW